MIDLRDHRLLDLSQSIEPGMWDYRPLDVPVPPVEVAPITTIADNGYSIHRFALNGLTGTYIESAAHMNDAAPLLDSFAPHRLIRPAKIMRLPPADGPYRLYSRADLEACDPGIEEGDALITVTGWKSDHPVDYVKKGPAFAYDCLEWFVKQPFSIWATDLTVANCLWAEQQGLEEEVGKDLLGDLYQRRPNMLLLAPLVNLEQVTADEGTLIALGMPIPGVCAVPARVLFLEDAHLAI